MAEGRPVPAELLRDDAERVPVVIPYEVDGRRERLVYLSSRSGELAAYEELRAGFTAAVSHELRTPLARLLVLLETAELPGADDGELLAQAAVRGRPDRRADRRRAVPQRARDGPRGGLARHDAGVPGTRREVAAEIGRAGGPRRASSVVVECDASVELPLRPRMLRVVAANLAENALRYAGEGTTFTLIAPPSRRPRVPRGRRQRPRGDATTICRGCSSASTAPIGHARRRGTGLGLAIVKHIVVSAGGTVEASRTPGGGLTVTCAFPG